MTAGELTKRVELLKQATTRDSMGALKSLGDPALVDRVWAKLRPLSGREYREAQQVKSETTHEVTIRFRRDVTTGMFVRYRQRTLHILSAINLDERDEWLVLQCKETRAS